MADLPRNSPEKIQALNALSHQDYLVSPWWRLRRHARLKKAGGKCERCAKVTTFQDVHHVYYTRLGEERDRDLEVLCRDCHNKLHHDQSRRQHIAIYERLARETLRLDKPKHIVDFKEAFRDRLKALKLDIDHRFDDAITIVWDKKQVSLATAARQQEAVTFTAKGIDLPLIGKPEAVDLCRRLGFRFPFKSMPEMAGTGLGVAAIQERAARRLKFERCPKCQHQGAQLSGVEIGSLFCTACQHRWPLLRQHIL